MPILARSSQAYRDPGIVLRIQHGSDVQLWWCSDDDYIVEHARTRVTQLCWSLAHTKAEKKKNVVFPVTRSTLVIRGDPKVFKPFHEMKILPPNPDPVKVCAKNRFL